MPSESSVFKLNAAVLKLMKIVGNPDWYQGVSSEWKDENPTIVITVNKLIPAKIVKYNVPMDIDNIPIKLIYRNPTMGFYGKDGPSIHL